MSQQHHFQLPVAPLARNDQEAFELCYAHICSFLDNCHFNLHGIEFEVILANRMRNVVKGSNGGAEKVYEEGPHLRIKFNYNNDTKDDIADDFHTMLSLLKSLAGNEPHRSACKIGDLDNTRDNQLCIALWDINLEVLQVNIERHFRRLHAQQQLRTLQTQASSSSNLKNKKSEIENSLLQALANSTTPQRYQIVINILFHDCGITDIERNPVLNRFIDKTACEGRVVNTAGRVFLDPDRFPYHEVANTLRGYMPHLINFLEEEAKAKDVLRVIKRFSVTDANEKRFIAECFNDLYHSYDNEEAFNDAFKRIKTFLIQKRLECRGIERSAALKYAEQYIGASNEREKREIIMQCAHSLRKGSNEVSRYFDSFVVLRYIDTPEKMQKRLEDNIESCFHELFAEEYEVLNGIERMQFKGNEQLYRGIPASATTQGSGLTREQVIEMFNKTHRAIKKAKSNSDTKESVGSYQIRVPQNPHNVVEDEPTEHSRATVATACTMDPNTAVTYALGKNRVTEGWVLDIRPKAGKTAVNLSKYTNTRNKYMEFDFAQIDTEDIYAAYLITPRFDGCSYDFIYYEVVDTIPNPHYETRAHQETYSFCFPHHNRVRLPDAAAVDRLKQTHLAQDTVANIAHDHSPSAVRAFRRQKRRQRCSGFLNHKQHMDSVMPEIEWQQLTILDQYSQVFKQNIIPAIKATLQKAGNRRGYNVTCHENFEENLQFHVEAAANTTTTTTTRARSTKETALRDIISNVDAIIHQNICRLCEEKNNDLREIENLLMEFYGTNKGIRVQYEPQFDRISIQHNFANNAIDSKMATILATVLGNRFYEDFPLNEIEELNLQNMPLNNFELYLNGRDNCPNTTNGHSALSNLADVKIKLVEALLYKLLAEEHKAETKFDEDAKAYIQYSNPPFAVALLPDGNIRIEPAAVLNRRSLRSSASTTDYLRFLRKAAARNSEVNVQGTAIMCSPTQLARFAKQYKAQKAREQKAALVEAIEEARYFQGDGCVIPVNVDDGTMNKIAAELDIEIRVFGKDDSNARKYFYLTEKQITPEKIRAIKYANRNPLDDATRGLINAANEVITAQKGSNVKQIDPSEWLIRCKKKVASPQIRYGILLDCIDECNERVRHCKGNNQRVVDAYVTTAEAFLKNEAVLAVKQAQKQYKCDQLTRVPTSIAGGSGSASSAAASAVALPPIFEQLEYMKHFAKTLAELKDTALINATCRIDGDEFNLLEFAIYRGCFDTAVLLIKKCNMPVTPKAIRVLNNSPLPDLMKNALEALGKNSNNQPVSLASAKNLLEGANKTPEEIWHALLTAAFILPTNELKQLVQDAQQKNLHNVKNILVEILEKQVTIERLELPQYERNDRVRVLSSGRPLSSFSITDMAAAATAARSYPNADGISSAAAAAAIVDTSSSLRRRTATSNLHAASTTTTTAHSPAAPARNVSLSTSSAARASAARRDNHGTAGAARTHANKQPQQSAAPGAIAAAAAAVVAQREQKSHEQRHT